MEQIREQVRLEFDSLSQNEEFARVTAAVFMSRLNPTLEEVDDVKTAVSEAVTNAVIHGYGEGEGRIQMEMTVDWQERSLLVAVRDQGAGIPDIARAREPMLSLIHILGQLLMAWAPVLYAGVLSCGVGYTLQIIGQKGMNPTVASLILSLESSISVLAGWVILGQRLTSRELWGCVLMFGAIILAQLPNPVERKGKRARI